MQKYEKNTGYRYGGEEFIIVLPQADETQAFRIVDRPRSSFGDYKFKLKLSPDNSTGNYITISI